MNKKTIMMQQYKYWIWSVVGIVLMVIVGAMKSGCTTTKYVPVPEVHTEHHWHNDTVIQKDSVVKESLTTVMQLDSAAMAQYGITLQKAERAWLVKTQEMERIIQELMAKSEAKDTVRDSSPYPVEVIKEVPAQLSWIQRAKQYLANLVLCLIAAVVVVWIGKGLFKL